jgi:protein SCO1
VRGVPPRLALALATLTLCAAAAVAGVWLAERNHAGDRPLQVGAAGFAGSVRPAGARMPDVTLRDQDGRRVALAGLRGGPVVVTFVYSTCRETCPAQVQAVRSALDRLDRGVRVLAVSVDPAGDTQARARRFINAQRMTGRMAFLLGSRAQLQPVWRAFAISPQRGALDHSAYTVVVDGRGAQRVAFPFEQLTPEVLAHDVARLRRTAPS